MKVIYSDRARRWGEGFALLQKATTCLEEILGPSAGEVTAEWDRAENGHGSRMFALRLSDETGAATAVFTPDELESYSHMRQWLNFLWVDLLQTRSAAILQGLTGAPKDY
ncbi:MAG TPA: hypothetical protein DDY78_00840 [Planctomycetales bacterium]|jgi:hypothetical protein|nr:hypothetical protein [Planctomycetales bacterium]